jgi:hypothetical protein
MAAVRAASGIGPSFPELGRREASKLVRADMSQALHLPETDLDEANKGPNPTDAVANKPAEN